jgi:hypothetical protein
MRAWTKSRLSRLGRESVESVAGDIEQLAQHSVGPGVVDPFIVLVLRVARRLFWPLLLGGITWVIVIGQLDAVATVSLATPEELFRALLTPFAGIALAIVLRLLSTLLGSLAATPRAVADHRRSDPRRWPVLRSPADVAALVAAYRLLRFTAAARDVAASRLGGTGRVFLLVDRVETWAVPIAVTALVLAIRLGA